MRPCTIRSSRTDRCYSAAARISPSCNQTQKAQRDRSLTGKYCQIHPDPPGKTRTAEWIRNVKSTAAIASRSAGRGDFQAVKVIPASTGASKMYVAHSDDGPHRISQQLA